MTDIPLVSVIIPAYNSAGHLKQSIQSIENQTYQNFEMIVVDDTQADDGTQAIIRGFNDERIRYIHPPERLGMVKSLNMAIDLANGKYIARMDADDISHALRFEKQVDYLEKHKEVGVVGCSCYTIDERGKVTGVMSHPMRDEDIKAKLMFNSAFIHPSVMMRKDLFLKNRYDEECYCCEDYELWSRLMHVTKFHNLKERLFKYRCLDGGAMKRQLKRLMDDSDYYQKHVSLLKRVYDSVHSYFSMKGEELNREYADLTFAKRIDGFTIRERESFLGGCERYIRKKNNSGYVNRCIAYQWIKMTKKDFIRTKRPDWLFYCFMELFRAGTDRISARLKGACGSSRNLYRWKL